MSVNAALDQMLIHTCDVRTVTDSVVNGVTKLSGSSTATARRCHIQPVSPDHVQTKWGLEKRGDFEAFFNSTETIVERQLVTGQTGPWTGVKFWIRAVRPVTDTGLDHIQALLERTTSTSV